MRVVAIIAAYNERRFIGACLAHLERHGVEAYLIDNCSTDDTVELAEEWLGRNLLGIETRRRGKDDVYDWSGLLRRKEELATTLDADWFIHLDPDEIRLPPPGEPSLSDALERADQEGFNAVNFREFTFIPTKEEPDHDHPGFEQTLRTYYHFEPRYPHQLKAWKATDELDLTSSGGHRVSFPGLRMYPRSFPLKHYLFLSVPHAVEKYVDRHYAAEEVDRGWHGWRARLTAAAIDLPDRSALLLAGPNDDLDPSEPRRTHWVEPNPDPELRA